METNNKIKIALVDDHQMFLDGMISVLSNQKEFEIVFVENNPQVALLKIRTNIPDILISDISMPEMNGLEFIKMVKKDFPHVKILVLSMFDSLQSVQDIDGYLLKETNTEELINIITDIVQNDTKHFGSRQIIENSFDFKKSILTDREKEVIQLIANECTTDQIAEKLNTSKSTIETHRKNIFYKLQVKNIAGLIKKAIYLGVVK
ncbi:response regulator [Flavobacterium sp.]|jgi:DNA-binding NarL/FixJ family response regulator|uniref:response regulator transcription factor n=1 Tax=Flavobacterium sp. TaxID=239 RepID=UPI0037BF7F8B